MLVIIALIVIMFFALSEPPEVMSAGDVVVVRGPSMAGPLQPRADTTIARMPAPKMLDERAGLISATDHAALTHERISEFPTLENVNILCTDVCMFTSTALEVRDKDVDASRLPYLGRLEDELRRRGFAPVDDLMVEEAGGGESTLRLRFGRS
ncbi:hypothetical protein [Sphingomonas sp. CFBP 8760]|uniref:hypothetical protein n=1 Tax=Sphingomonas sp. CFBP 8760 TaxID=2775282 RepID=UPI00177B89E8|nr:hypothetical protein [Sphingomonas sp. CFBP 8760]MBD8549000.1 hypothetical protein [Sphingomonas sp. CFBP 8760]